MLYKYETKSNRVKGLSFHPTRPWILASLHSGAIHLYDYRIKTLLEKFEEHDGPVRGVNFHMTQPLFVSGGDDYKIKVWNYKQRRCLFTLKGHKDYIRTVEFHREAPWILSASDDQVIRIWNWQSRTCIAELNGHNHYVMCASFHPKDDLIVSASLDQTIRIWDISGLKKKTTTIKPYPQNDTMRLQEEIFGTDVVVKLSLEGHDRGVNWAAFHPTQPYIVSASDDHQVKLWKMNDNVDSFRGHFNNVSCALFHPRQDLIISDSEDKTIRVWDMAKKTTIQTIRREHDRFWTLASHPNANLFAAGHDSGMIVFKLERERPTFVLNGTDGIFYLKKKHFNSYDFSTGRSVVLFNISKIPSNNGTTVMSYNAAERSVLVSSDADAGTYHLYRIPTRDTNQVDTKKGTGAAAIFVGSNRFAVLDKGNNIVIKDLNNEEVKRFQPAQTVEWLFPAPVGHILVMTDEKMILYDIQQKNPVAEIAVPSIRYVVWSKDFSYVAMMGRDSIILANRRLEQICVVGESVLPKSGVWDEHGVFIYTTSNHLKYLLPNGDNGTIKTMDSTMYLTGVKGSKVFAIDREFKKRVIEIDNTEYILKLSLLQKRYGDVIKILRESRLVGRSIIGYLQRKGYPDVVHFVKDDRTRFNLALECGNIDIALQSAKILDDKECWTRLGVEALRQGNQQIVEMAYSRTGDFDRLSFLHLLTGNLTTLKKMINYDNTDIMSKFQYSLYLGDVEERVKLLHEAGLNHLAYITAATNNLKEKAEQIASHITADGKGQLPALPKHVTPLLPPKPVYQAPEINWPLLNIAKTSIDMNNGEVGKFGLEEQVGSGGGSTPIGGGGWDDDIMDEDENANNNNSNNNREEGGGWDDDLDIETTGEGWGGDDVKIAASNQDNFFVAPQPGPSFAQIWTRNSNFAVDHVAAGSFETAMNIFNQQVGIVNFEPLRQLFLSIHMGARLSLGGIASTSSLIEPVQRKHGQPFISYGINYLLDRLKTQAYPAFTIGKLPEAQEHFSNILQCCLVSTVESRQEFNEVRELIGICREYIAGIRLETERRTLNDDPKRQAELAAYFTHCTLQSSHILLTIRAAMNCCYRAKYFAAAASFAKRLLDLSPPQELAVQARKVITASQQSPAAPDSNLNYDERNPFVVCGETMTPIYRGSPSVKCPLCMSSYLPNLKGQVCKVCNLAEIGKEASGLQLVMRS
ncbi:WD40 repeat-containing protein [Heterostelium album PN500]|uniref:Coatomer subunit alpha n=1 Tax=Heterostelium pallidum (strain ATCC 26659 / Pp 5 / PN500) TaxID=670386 RepID=D3B3V5_HETP5|nr:WD40 repeat-containing protein [Heterostelium album PN500]EFA84003.1 WD40 repeat-containing protein [Heterostelium album PN500]|eukprot:XP_020436120.1 WD40 repeat-containing protein [Heterostelium album PN500]